VLEKTTAKFVGMDKMDISTNYTLVMWNLVDR
jgi:hypothetical protein